MKSSKGQPKRGKRKGYNDRTKGNTSPVRKYDEKRDDDTRRMREAINDFSWYNRNPLLTEAAARIPFPYRPGMDLPVNLVSAPANYTVKKYTIPGVMSLQWVPTIGQSANPTDPANIAAKEVFKKVRESFSGSIEADAPDFIIYLMALDSIFSYIGALKRVYRILNAYTPSNYVTPDILLASIGVTPNTVQNLRQNKTQFCGIINELVGMTHKFRCPAVFDVFNRHYWLNDNVYTDAGSINAQFYAFRQTYYLQYTLAKTPADVDAGALKYLASPLSTDTTVDALFTFGRSLINALAESDDAYIISGYLTRAYEGKPDFVVNELGFAEEFKPVYLPEVLAQIENSWGVQQFGTINYTNWTITQDPATNSLLSNPKVTMNASMVFDAENLITIRSESPTVVDVVEATRLKAAVDSAGNVICATEVPIEWKVYTGVGNLTNEWSYSQNVSAITNRTNPSATNLPTSISSLAGQIIGTQFDWSPLVWVWMISEKTTTVTPFIFGDTHNLSVITDDALKELHKVCLYSEFNSFEVS